MEPYTNEVILKAIQDNDIELLRNAIDNGVALGNGVSRQAIAISDGLVAKVPFYAHCDQTDAEIYFYDKYYDRYSHLMPKMCGVVAIHSYKTALIMERVIPLEGYIHTLLREEIADDELRNNTWDEIESFIHETQLQDSDNNVGNWGKRANGEFVVLDCGMHGPEDYYYDGYNCSYGGYC